MKYRIACPPLLAAVLLAGCTSLATSPVAPSASAPVEEREATVVLVSIDGFREDYADRSITPNLRKLGAAGVVAAGMRPSYPSKTYPNHYTLVTGLRPDRHGIVDNTMRDPAIPGQTFRLSDRATVHDPRWWDLAEPVWVSAAKARIPTAALYWPGSETSIRGERPDHWALYDKSVTAEERVDKVLGWMDLPGGERPRFVALYFDDVDTAGHDFGPDAPETDAAVKRVDRAIGALRSGFAARGLPVNLIVVSDHGMAATGINRVIALDGILPALNYDAILSGTHAAITPTAGRESAVRRAFIGRHPHMNCWAKDDIPARFYYGHSPRIAPILCAADTGWLIYSSVPVGSVPAGSHGYDNADPSMRALFVAAGPDFRPRIRLGTIDNVDVYPLVMRLLRLEAVPGDGNLAVFQKALEVGD